ncbi:MAG: TldD/PmbA family protein [Chloroflexi bacterium]|nr:MAG: TldD/PmbA family protein [Chloroflexota bacterium]
MVPLSADLPDDEHDDRARRVRPRRDPQFGEGRRLREEDGRRPGRRGVGQLRVRDHRVLPHPRRQARRAAAWGDARWSGTEAHERDRHGRLGPRLLDRHVRQGWPGRAEVFLREAQSGTVETKDGEIEVVIARGERGLGVRVLDGERMGFAHSSDLAAAGIEACVEQSRRMSRITEPDADLGIASRALDVADLAIYHAGLERRALADRGAIALAVEKAARGADPRITHFRKTSYLDAEVTTIIATTTGVRASYRETTCGAMTSPVATSNGERQIGYHGEGARRLEDLDPAAIGARAAKRATEKLGAKPFATQKLPVVLDPWMAQSLLGAIAPLFSADNVLKGRSLFANKVGSKVANERVTIVDDARRKGGLRSAPFDGEGTPTTTRTLMDKGVLRGYLTNMKTANKMSTSSSGNARRGSYASPSRIGPSNFYVEAGVDDPKAMVARLDRALAVTSGGT